MLQGNTASPSPLLRREILHCRDNWIIMSRVILGIPLSFESSSVARQWGRRYAVRMHPPSYPRLGLQKFFPSRSPPSLPLVRCCLFHLIVLLTGKGWAGFQMAGIKSHGFLAVGELCTDRRNHWGDKIHCSLSTDFPPKTAERLAFTHS